MQINIAPIFLMVAALLGLYQTVKAAEPAKEDGEAARHLSADNAALTRSDFSAANSEWALCLLTIKDIGGQIAKECEERLNKNKDRHTAIPSPDKLAPLARVAHAPISVKGLSDAVLMKARTQNMYEAFLDCELLERDIATLRANESDPGTDIMLKRAEETLRLCHKRLTDWLNRLSSLAKLF